MAKPKDSDTDAAAGGGQDVVTRKPQALPAALQDRAAEDAGKGVSTDAADNLVPMIYVLQSNSKQVDRKDSLYVDGAEAGSFLMRGSNTVLEDFEFQPCHFYKEVVEWIPRTLGGGFVARHDTMPGDAKEIVDPQNPNKKRYTNEDGSHEYIECRVFAGYARVLGSAPMPYVISLSSTGHTVGRGWMFMANSKVIAGKPAPLWAGVYKLTTKQKSNAKGKWYALNVEDMGYVQTVEEYDAGKMLFEAFQSGAKQAAAPETLDANDGGTDGGTDDAADRAGV